MGNRKAKPIEIELVQFQSTKPKLPNLPKQPKQAELEFPTQPKQAELEFPALRKFPQIVPHPDVVTCDKFILSQIGYLLSQIEFVVSQIHKVEQYAYPVRHMLFKRERLTQCGVKPPDVFMSKLRT